MYLEPDEITYDDIGRVYWIGGEPHYSVTSILGLIEDKSWLSGARQGHIKRNPDYTWHDYTSDAMLLGTYLHYQIGAELAIDRGLPIPEFEPERLIPDRTYKAPDFEYYNRRECFEVAMSFWEDFKVITHPTVYSTGIERFLYHSTGYAGRVDCVLQFDVKRWMKEMVLFKRNFNLLSPPRAEDVWLVDLKSSKSIYDEYPAQVWAYFQAWNERFPRFRCNRMAILRFNGETGWEFTETRGDKITWDRAMKVARDRGILSTSTPMGEMTA